ncbi:non-structural maintenance of chromosomes element 4 homolog A [Lepisosteus oculatus]|uniref:Non-structural maintenance of chromosomes element 4 n=1 Tax=Lepisosteus oculatus TaxID=7918 RepID=W5MQN9_LEPOC|nr:PREDICTED: non-structural maintenance of chromosomes element 4 homolog A [Lepisosteus oculatus]XP_015202279.1 PREDICTED: non-structural maintenance of chromosomes element 4 homolog A [Lepisosteus oculatus]
MSEARRASHRSQEAPAPPQNGVGVQRRAGEDSNEEEGSRPGGSNIHEEDDPATRRLIRHQYRELINNVQQNREDMLSPNNNKLTEALEEANKLFVNVRQAREAALDSQFLVLATDLGKEKASQLHAEGTIFDPSAFAEHLLSFMGLNRLEEEEDDSDEEGVAGGFLPQDAWHQLGREAEKCFRTSPSFHFMFGSFLPEPPPPRQRVERQRRAPTKDVRRIMPTQLKKMEESYQEATEKEVERILGFLQSYHDDDPTVPISYFDFVIDPKSFSRTVENIFHVSFLVRDGLAKIELDQSRLPIIAPVKAEEDAGSGPGRQQCVISISPRSWKEIIETFEIKEALITPPPTAKETES